MLSGPVLAKSIFPVRGSPQADLGKQETLVLPLEYTLPTRRALEEVSPLVGSGSSVESGRS